jgi:putative transposase
MAKARTTMRSALHYQPQHALVFAANQVLFNRVVAFYFDCIQAHEGILSLTNKEALTALERLTHATEQNPAPIMPLSEIAPDIPAMFRRAAINAAIGSARSFFSQLKKWRTRKERYEARPAAPSKKKKPWRRASAGPAAFLEQVGSLLCWTMEGSGRALCHAQSLDRIVLELDQDSHPGSRSARRF